jgi:cell division protein FtsN
VAASNARGLRPGGVVRAIIRLVLLIGFGFGSGLLIGVLSEEPELLAGHLRGEGEAIVLAEPVAVAAAVEQEIPVAQTPAELRVVVPVLDRKAAMEAQPEEEPKQPIPAVTAPPPIQVAESKSDRAWAIQVGAFSDEAAAQKLAQGLEAKGYPTKLLLAGPDSKRWRVRIQPVRGQANAREMAGELKRVERLPTWVIPMESRSSQ